MEDDRFVKKRRLSRY